MVKKNITKNIILAITVLILMGIIIFSVGRSYGFFQYIKKGETTNVVSIKGIKIEVIEDDNALNLLNAEPLYDEDGMKLKAFSFSITNTSSRPIAYTLKVVNDTDKQNACLINEGTEEETTCPVLTTDNIRYSYKLDNRNYTAPNNLGAKNDVITNYIINGKETLTYSIKIWIKKDATNEIMNHYFFGELLIQGQQSDGERVELESGLYTTSNQKLATWNTLVNDYNLDVSKNYTDEDIDVDSNDLEIVFAENINQTSLGYITNNNEEFTEGNKLVIDDSVTRIGDFALVTQNLDEVIIPNSVEEIGMGAFAYDGNLKSVNIAEDSQLKTIGEGAFILTGLKTLSVPSTVTEIGEYAFYGLPTLDYSGSATSEDNWGAVGSNGNSNSGDEYGLMYKDEEKTIVSRYVGESENVTIPSTVVEIGDEAFLRTNIESVYIPATVTKIGNNAFKNVTTLKSVIFENSATMEEIGYNAFKNTGIQSMEMPVKAKISFDAFLGIPTVYGYQTFGSTYPQNLRGAFNIEQYKDGDFLYADENKRILVSYIGTAKEVTIPNNVEYIYGNGVFIANGSTKIVNVPSTVKEIIGYAFYYIPVVNYSGPATGKWVNLSLNPYIEGDFAYSDSTKTTLLAYIGDSEDVVIPNTVTTIKEGVFAQFTIATSDRYPMDTLKNRSVNKVTVPSAVENISDNAFYSVNMVVYNGSATSESNWGAAVLNPYIEGDFAYSDSTKTTLVGYTGNDDTVTIPSTVTTIGTGAFYDTTAKNIIIPNGVETIKTAAFNSPNIENVNISSSVTTIESNAFGYSYKSGQIDIPSTVVNIAEYAFDGAVYVNYSGPATSESNWGALALNPYIDGNFIYKDQTKTTLIKYTGNSKIVLVPSEVKTIEKYAFYGTSVETVILPDGLTNIEKYAFYKTKLESINFPDSLTKIGNYAFYQTSLHSITIPANVNYIGGHAFNESKLTSVTFADTENWKYNGYEVESNEIADKNTAVTYIKYEKANYAWTKSE